MYVYIYILYVCVYIYLQPVALSAERILLQSHSNSAEKRVVEKDAQVAGCCDVGVAGGVRVDVHVHQRIAPYRKFWKRQRLEYLLHKVAMYRTFENWLQ